MEPESHHRVTRSSPTDVGSRRTLWIVAGVLVVIFSLIGLDVASDYRSGSSAFHLIVEAIVMILAGTGAAYIGQALRVARVEVSSLTRDIRLVEEEASRWRSETRQLLDGLATAMNRQFDRWELTEAEREIALELLKGRSHKEIARDRGTSERTVREQAHDVYLKSGLEGRATLAGFFLGGVLPLKRR